MKIIAMEVGYIATNCYIVVNEETHHGVIIDPGGDAGRIMEAVQKENLTVDAIFLTHGHGDHIMALAEVAEKTGAPVYISKEDAPMLTDPVGSLAAYIGGGALKKAAGIKFKVLATPGHTPGGVCLLTDGVVFCGDTVFAESIGRTDLPGGSYKQLLQSIKEKILPLDDDVKLLPGHGPATTVGWERRRNPFLQ